VDNRALSVFASGSHCGLLSRSVVEEQTFLFTYDRACADHHAVSLTMPVLPDQYDSVGTMHPVFEMNLPEGQLRRRLELMFSKVIPDFDALSLLALTGRSQLGRLRYAAQGESPEEVPAESVGTLLAYKGSEDLFDDLMERYARYSGISGMQPKVLVRDLPGPLDRMTDRGATHIVKSFDPREFPELAANEYFALKAAAYAGLPTAAARLSDNRKLLVVERFDRAADGSYAGFEDFCVLSGLRSAGRYHGSYEDLAQKVAVFVSPEHGRQAMEQLFGMIVLACVIRNGDAHLKNFAILYDAPGRNVRLAPAYDLVSTTPYQPKDVLALSLNGDRQFPSRKVLMQFSRHACGLSNRRATAIVGRVVEGVRKALVEMTAFGLAQPDFSDAAARFAKTYEEGLEVLAEGGSQPT
jgi:serine/threonine-protein kinase HipA